MRTAELIAIAKIRSGKEQQQMAAEMGISASRLSAVAKGKLQPNASEVAYLAQQAQTDPLRAIADIETEREPKFAPIWQRLLHAANS
jgi:transcriptional regulator with XRE-family HTH domain